MVLHAVLRGLSIVLGLMFTAECASYNEVHECGENHNQPAFANVVYRYLQNEVSCIGMVVFVGLVSSSFACSHKPM